MYKIFSEAFVLDGSSSKVGESNANVGDGDLIKLFEAFGGASFNAGLYRILSSKDVSRWNKLVADAFPAFGGRIACFGLDWLGRVFALDQSRRILHRPGVIIFEPGTGEALAVPCDLLDFHNSELIEHRDAALAESFFNRWIESGGASPNLSQCIGYKRPLFLGGVDELDNLELSDLDVYWTISAQLVRAARGA